MYWWRVGFKCKIKDRLPYREDGLFFFYQLQCTVGMGGEERQSKRLARRLACLYVRPVGDDTGNAAGFPPSPFRRGKIPPIFHLSPVIIEHQVLSKEVFRQIRYFYSCLHMMFSFLFVLLDWYSAFAFLAPWNALAL